MHLVSAIIQGVIWIIILIVSAKYSRSTEWENLGRIKVAIVAASMVTATQVSFVNLLKSISVVVKMLVENLV